MILNRKEKNILGLPFSLAVFYFILFAASFYFYFTVLKTAPILFPDSQKYMEVAQDLADFHLDAIHHRTLGYPLLLLLTGSSVNPTKLLFVVSLLMHFAAVWMMTVLLNRLKFDKKILSLFVLIMLLPPYAQSAAYVLTENLTCFFLTAGLLCFVSGLYEFRAKHLLLASVLFAFTAFVRPTYQLLSFCLSIILLFLSRRFSLREFFKAAVILFFSSFILIGSLIFFNGLKFGYFGFSPGLGHHLCTRTVHYIEQAPASYEPVRGMLIQARNKSLLEDGTDHRGLLYIWSVSGKIMKETNRNFLELDRYLLKLNKQLIFSTPLGYSLEVATSMIYYWYPYGGEIIFWKIGWMKILWTFLNFFIAGIFFSQLIFMVGSLPYLKNLKIKTEDNFLVLSYVFCGVIVFYTMILSCAVESGNARFRSPTDGFIIFMVFAGTKLCRIIWRLPGQNSPEKF